MKLLVLLTFSSGFAFAQVQSGRIVGTVYDQSHAAVPKATVTVVNTATNISRRVLTDAGGDYVVTPVDPGTYSVSASAPGFQSTVRGAVGLTVGLAARVEGALPVRHSLAQRLEPVLHAPHGEGRPRSLAGSGASRGRGAS